MIFHFGKYEIIYLCTKLVPGREVDSIESKGVGYESALAVSEESSSAKCESENEMGRLNFEGINS